ncbi:MAG TPA: galactokinase [Actinomycetales bacterium]|nr:galactokinase [Actinomycetales bacterium]
MTEPVWLQPRPAQDHAQQAVEGYRLAFGSEPDGVWSAPGRVNLIGEHTDYNGGLCLPLAIPYRTVVAAGRADDGVLQLRSAQLPAEPYDGRLDDVGPGSPQGWAAYVAGVPWAIRQTTPPAADRLTTGLRVFVDSDVPSGAGLSSSAALSCSTALAVDELAALGLGGDDAGRAELASACVLAENDVAGAPTGGMDQQAALRCTAGHALLLDCRPGLRAADATRQVPLALHEHGLTLLVIDTQAPHALVDGQYAQRRAACHGAAARLGVETLRDLADRPVEEVLAALEDDVQRRRVRHVLSEIARVQQVVALLDEDRVAETGLLMNASHASLRDDYEVSCRELDVAVEQATNAGALGARMTGGGFGGSALALVPTDAVEEVASAVVRAYAEEGLRAPRFAHADPSPAGSRYR